MKVLIIPLAGGVGLGPLTRCLAVASEARHRGHQVAFLCRQSFAEVVHGFRYEVWLAPTPNPTGIPIHPYRLSDVALGLGWIEEAYLEAAVRKELDVMNVFKPDVVFTETQFSVAISAPTSGIPWAAATSWADHPEFQSELYGPGNTRTGLERQVNNLLRRYGLKPVSDVCELAFLRADLKLAATIPALQPELTALAHINFVGFLLSPELEHGSLPQAVQEWDRSRPVVYVYLSPGEIPAEHWIPRIVEAYRSSPFNVMIALAPLQIAEHELPGARNVRFFARLPGRSAIERSDLVICHGGANTVANCLLLGKPAMIFPDMYAEREYNARAIEKQGAGLNLPTKDFNRDELLATSTRMVEDKRFASNAALLGKAMTEYGGPQRSVSLLETLA